MTVKQISGSRHFTGLSTDSKPTPSADKVTIGSTFFESDTGLRYEYTGDGWSVDANSLAGGDVSAVNSTSTPLPADTGGDDHIFTGDAVDITDVAMITLCVFSDQDSAIDGLVIEQSVDGTNWDHDDKYSITANDGKVFTPNKAAKFARIIYTNRIVEQTEFRLQTILNYVYGKPSSHRVDEDILGQDDAELNIVVIKVPTNDATTLKNVDVNNPFPTDGDSVYAKDLDKDIHTTIGTFTGDIDTLFNDYDVEITDVTGTDPKTFTIRFLRPITTSQIGIGSGTGDFSNVKIQLKDLAGTVRGEVDDSSDNTKFTSNVYPFSPITFIEMVVEFHTTDPVKLNGMFIPKDASTVARIQGQKPDGTVVDFEATAGGNFKISLEEFDEALNDNPLPVHVIDIHSVIVNEHFRKDSGVSELLGSSASIGDSIITVANGATFLANQRIVINEGTIHDTDVFKIISISTNDLTLDKPLENDYTTAAVVERTEINLATSIGTIASPDVFTITPPADEVWHIGRIIIAIADDGAMDDGKFGGITALTNGVVFRLENDETENITVWRTNGDMAEDMYDITYTDKAPAGENGLRGRMSFNKVGVAFKLDGSLGHQLKLICQDVLTGLTEYEIRGQGHIVGR